MDFAVFSAGVLTVRGARITWALPDLGQLVSILTDHWVVSGMSAILTSIRFAFGVLWVLLVASSTHIGVGIPKLVVIALFLTRFDLQLDSIRVGCLTF